MKTLKDYAMSFLGLPYIWGGSNTINGYDCSGLVQEILASVGMEPPLDMTANGLYHHFLETGDIVDDLELGALVFYGNANRIKHVAFCIDNFRVIEAGGGNSSCKTKEVAAKFDAFVRIRPYNHRKDLMSIIMPVYEFKK